MDRPQDIWKPRYCPRCHAWPGVPCRTATGKRAGLPHRERFPLELDPSGPRGVKKAIAAEMVKEPAPMADVIPIERKQRPPLYIALRDRLEDQMASFRERSRVAPGD